MASPATAVGVAKEKTRERSKKRKGATAEASTVSKPPRYASQPGRYRNDIPAAASRKIENKASHRKSTSVRNSPCAMVSKALA